MKKIIVSLIEYVKGLALDKKENYIDYIKKIEFKDNNKISMNTNDILDGDIFFAINRGNDYIDVALEKGASFVICGKEQIQINERVLHVDDTIVALQKIANIYRNQCQFKVVAITGSNGKTSTKDILYDILKEKFKVERTKGNLNTQIGVPYTLLNAHENLDYIVLEMGMSDFGHIDSLCKVAEPDYGIITNIGLSHIEYLKTRENVFKAKGEMLKYVPKERVFLNSDDEFLKNVQGNKIGFNSDILENEGCKNYIITDFSNNESGSDFYLNGEKYETNLFGIYNSVNISLGVALALQIGLTKDEIMKGLKNIVITPMRFEKLKWQELDVINDAYNASPISVKLALETFNDVFKNREKIAVLGDMLELGEKEDEYHVEVIEKALSLGYKNIFLFGERMKKASSHLNFKNGMEQKVECFLDKNEIRERLIELNGDNPVIFLKGSRGMKLEEIIK